MDMNAATLFRVHLVDEATVVERGERVRVWFLPLEDSWIRAATHPSAETNLHDSGERDPGCPPGTVWQRHVELLLPRRTPLLSRVTTPLVERLNPIQYLTKDRRGVRRHVEETWFEVVGNYRISRSEPPSAFVRARKAHHGGAVPRSDTPGKNRS